MKDSCIFPGCFAIDFIRVDRQGHYGAGNDDSIKNWFGYSQKVIAAAPGVVLSVTDTFPESATLSAHSNPGPEMAAGNYISIAIGKNRILFYEHLKPGSILVRKGDIVKKGQVIAALGYTGQTTGPHLHLHVANMNSSLGADGLPYAFEQYVSMGYYSRLDGFGKTPFIRLPRSMKKNERPAPGSVVTFTP